MEAISHQCLAGDFRSLPPSAWSRLHDQFAAVCNETEKISEDPCPRCSDDGCAPAPVPEDYTITLDRSTGSKLGIGIASESGLLPWVIESIDGGLVGAWNEDSGNEQVMPGDCIVEANGVRDAVEMISECRKAQVLTLHLSRQGGAAIVRSGHEHWQSGAGVSTPLSLALTANDGYVGLMENRSPPRALQIIAPPDSFANWPFSPAKAAFMNWPYSPDSHWSAFNATVADSPWTLSETYQEMTPKCIASARTDKNEAPLLQDKHMLESLRLPSSCQGEHTWKIVSGTTAKKHVQRGMQFVKSKGKKVVVKTRKGFAAIQALPTPGLPTMQISRTKDGELARRRVHRSVSMVVEYVRGQAHLEMESGESAKEKVFKGVSEVFDQVNEQVRLERENFQIPPQLQKGLKYADTMSERALTASTTLSERLTQTAQKGLNAVRKLGRAGGA